MSAPTIHEAARLVAQHYGMTTPEVLTLLRTPLHPAGLRDQFAGQALQGMGVRQSHPDTWETKHLEMATEAYAMADAMLAARLPLDRQQEHRAFESALRASPWYSQACLTDFTRDHSADGGYTDRDVDFLWEGWCLSRGLVTQ